MATQAVTVKVEGLRELEDALKELPRATAKNVMKRALIKAAEPLIADAEAQAPVKTGQLQKSIDYGSKLTRRQRAKSRKQSEVEVYVGVTNSLPQGHLQEFGTSEFPPQPFMRPAWDSNRKGILDTIKDLTWAELKKAADRLARKAARAKAKAGG